MHDAARRGLQAERRRLQTRLAAIEADLARLDAMAKQAVSHPATNPRTPLATADRAPEQTR